MTTTDANPSRLVIENRSLTGDVSIKVGRQIRLYNIREDELNAIIVHGDQMAIVSAFSAFMLGLALTVLLAYFTKPDVQNHVALLLIATFFFLLAAVFFAMGRFNARQIKRIIARVRGPRTPDGY